MNYLELHLLILIVESLLTFHLDYNLTHLDPVLPFSIAILDQDKTVKIYSRPKPCLFPSLRITTPQL